MTTNNDLNVGLARLMGWREYEHGGWTWLADGDEATYKDGTRVLNVPNWSGSLDALFASGGPVEYARNKGWSVDLTCADEQGWGGWATHMAFDAVVRYATDPAEALATALHKAFMKEQGQ